MKLDVEAGSSTRSAYFRSSSTDHHLLTLFNSNLSAAAGGQWAIRMNGSVPRSLAAYPIGAFLIHQDGIGTRLVILPSTGNVGIGTTNPGSLVEIGNAGVTDDGGYLHVNGDAVGGYATVLDNYGTTDDGNLIIRTGNTGGTGNLILAESNHPSLGGSGVDAEFRVTNSGVVTADGSFTGGGADYAEWFEKEENIEQGALVGLNAITGKARVWRKRDVLIGVQSMNPGFIGNNFLGVEGTEEDMKKSHVLVALVGQVEIRSDDIREKDRKVFTTDNQLIGWRLSSGKVLIK